MALKGYTMEHACRRGSRRQLAGRKPASESDSIPANQAEFAEAAPSLFRAGNHSLLIHSPRAGQLIGGGGDGCFSRYFFNPFRIHASLKPASFM